MTFMMWPLVSSYGYNGRNHRNAWFILSLAETSSYWFQDGDDVENITEDGCEKEQTSLYPLGAKKKLFSVHIRPHVGNLSDYPYCITPLQIVCW